jgi:ATP-dependent helicase HrpB
LQPLPIDPFLPQIAAALDQARAVVVIAQPGAGKTTRVPPLFSEQGPVILLQPRRVAARAIARRIAEERGWTLGREVGWQTRYDSRFTDTTRLLVATEGILTGRLQRDPLLSDFQTIVLDEFHERSVHADLAIALAKQAWRARSDLRIAVMSATLDAAAVARFLDGCPIVDVPGRLHPLTIRYQPGAAAADAAADLLSQTSGDVLCFLPGAFEIRAAAAALTGRVDADVIPLYGALDSEQQDRALRPAPEGRRRIVVATNIAETSVTVPGVTAVVDSGRHKVARYDAARGLDSLESERISADSAAQRAGRAGRLAPGIVVRLWDERDRLRPHREPEIHRIDLSGPLLDVMAWGGDPRTLDWFEAPRGDAIDRAVTLLDRLGAIADGRLTNIGGAMDRLALHPRLARMLIEAAGHPRMALACAVVAERHFLASSVASGFSRTSATWSDLLSATDHPASLPDHIRHAARDIERQATAALRAVTTGSTPDIRSFSDESFCQAILAGYPDRVAQRRAPGSARVKLASGTGAALAPQSGVRDGEFLVALDLRATDRDAEPQIRLASRVERDWLRATRTDVVHRYVDDARQVRAASVDYYDALVLRERPAPLDPEVAAPLLTDAWLAQSPRPNDVQLMRRSRFAGAAFNLRDAVLAAAYGARSLDEVKVADSLPPALVQQLDRDAPASLVVPSGRAVRLEYLEDGSVRADVKLQELFGLAETPKVGPRREPVLLALLAPNGRPVQMTRDLRSFWERTYPEVRKELRGRYPKHPWPEDPWNAVATARTTSRRSGPSR